LSQIHSIWQARFAARCGASRKRRWYNGEQIFPETISRSCVRNWFQLSGTIMKRNVVGAEIERLIQLLSRLPGLGPRSARRAALHLVKNREKLMRPLGAALADVLDKVSECGICGNVVK